MDRLIPFLLAALMLGACGSSVPADGTVCELADERPRPIPLDSLLRDVRFVRTETSDDALLSDYSLVRRAGDEVWVCDRETGAFLCFGPDGVLRERFSRRGRGPQEYLGVRDFRISAAGEIWAVGSLDKLLVYDRQGRLLRQRRLPPDAETLALGGDFCAVQFRRSEKMPYGVLTFDAERLEPVDSLAEGGLSGSISSIWLRGRR